MRDGACRNLIATLLALVRPSGAFTIPAAAAGSWHGAHSSLLMCTVERTTVIHPGSANMPPLVQVPGGELLLEAVVKPPDVDALTQWEKSRGNAQADSSWGSVWPGAVNLAAFLAENPALVRGRSVAELGSGLGIAGLTAAKVGASTVTLVDREPFALHCAMSTAVVCGLPTGPVPDGGEDAAAFYVDDAPTGVVSASMVDWSSLPGNGLEVDVVLASEILYEDRPCNALEVARAAAALLRRGGTLLLADPADGRVSGAYASVAEALGAMGARVSEQRIPAPPAGDAWYSLRAGDGKASVAGPNEAVVLLRADFERPPDL